MGRGMRRTRLPHPCGLAAILAPALMLAACAERETPQAGESDAEAVRHGVDLAVADVLAAEQAASTPLPARNPAEAGAAATE